MLGTLNIGTMVSSTDNRSVNCSGNNYRKQKIGFDVINYVTGSDVFNDFGNDDDDDDDDDDVGIRRNYFRFDVINVTKNNNCKHNDDNDDYDRRRNNYFRSGVINNNYIF